VKPTDLYIYIYIHEAVSQYLNPCKSKVYRLGNTIRKGPLSKKGKLTLAVCNKEQDFIREQVTKILIVAPCIFYVFIN